MSQRNTLRGDRRMQLFLALEVGPHLVLGLRLGQPRKAIDSQIMDDHNQDLSNLFGSPLVVLTIKLRKVAVLT